MRIEAEFFNKTSNIFLDQPVTVEASDSDIERIWRQLLYKYGNVISAEKVDTYTRRYVLLSKAQYSDTNDTYELEARITITKESAFSDSLSIDKSACVSV